MNQSTLELAHVELDESEFAEAWRNGANLSLDAAVELALGAAGTGV